MQYDEIHIGKLIHKKLKEQGRSVTWLAKKSCCTRQNIYRIFESPWINTDLLSKLCDILDCNFFKVYADHWEDKKRKV